MNLTLLDFEKLIHFDESFTFPPEAASYQRYSKKKRVFLKTLQNSQETHVQESLF